MSSPQTVGTIIISGPPAGGKSTQCKRLLNRYGLVHISAGDLLRARQKLIPELAEYMNRGALVPDDLVCSIIKERLAEKDCQDKGVLLDGFPRTRKQAEVLHDLGVKVNHVILLDVPDDVAISRVAGRRIDPVSGEVYHIEKNPPTKPEVLERLVIRDDDTPEKMKERLRMYHSNIRAIKRFYGPRKVHKVLAVLHPDAVFDRVRDIVEGDMYWGCLINRDITVRTYESSAAFDIGGSMDMITISRYFEHMKFLMQARGALSDVIDAASVRFVVRGHVLELEQMLVPGLKVSLRIWIENVGRTSLTLGHYAHTTMRDLKEANKLVGRMANGALYQEAIDAILENANLPELRSGKASDAALEQAETAPIEVARGTTSIVALEESTGKPMEIPNRNKLQNLVLHGGSTVGEETELQKRLRTNYTARKPLLVEFSKTRIDGMEPSPPDAYEMSWLVEPKDLDMEGLLSSATCVGYLEKVRFVATANSGYSGEQQESPRDRSRDFKQLNAGLHSSAVSASSSSRRMLTARPRCLWMETQAMARLGDRVLMRTWLLKKPSAMFDRAIKQGCKCVGFELYTPDRGNQMILRGVQVVSTPMDVSPKKSSRL